MCYREHKEDTTHVLKYSHHLFQLHRNKIVLILQFKVLGLLDENMFPLCFLQWILNENEENMEEVLDYITSSLTQ